VGADPRLLADGCRAAPRGSPHPRAAAEEAVEVVVAGPVPRLTSFGAPCSHSASVIFRFEVHLRTWSMLSLPG
jgi:hypothetical protein